MERRHRLGQAGCVSARNDSRGRPALYLDPLYLSEPADLRSGANPSPNRWDRSWNRGQRVPRPLVPLILQPHIHPSALSGVFSCISGAQAVTYPPARLSGKSRLILSRAFSPLRRPRGASVAPALSLVSRNRLSSLAPLGFCSPSLPPPIFAKHKIKQMLGEICSLRLGVSRIFQTLPPLCLSLRQKHPLVRDRLSPFQPSEKRKIHLHGHVRLSSTNTESFIGLTLFKALNELHILDGSFLRYRNLGVGEELVLNGCYLAVR